MTRSSIGSICFLLWAFLSPTFASAEIITASSPQTDATWSSSNVYIVGSSFIVPAGVTLTILPGTIIKMSVTGLYGPTIYGRLVAAGTAAAPIYFTSILDDARGGDTDGAGPSTGDLARWQGLYFMPGSTGSLDHIDLSYSGYGGYGYGDCVGIENNDGNLDIKNSNIHDNFIIGSNGAGGSVSCGYGVYNKRGTLSVSDSTLENDVWGIRIDSGTSTITNSVFKNNVDSTGYSDGIGLADYGTEPLTLIDNLFTGNKRTATINANSDFVHRGNRSEDQTYRGFKIDGLLTKDVRLYGGDLPLIVQYLIVSEGKTLTMDPGTILKMDDYYGLGAITVRGTLNAKGAADKKIYFTSLKDDSVGGDTNGDGGATAPGPRNWNAVYLENSSRADFDNVALRYGGYNFNGEYMPGVAAAIYVRDADFSVANSYLDSNWGTAIFQDAGTTTITQSEFSNQNMGIWTRGEAKVTISQSSLHDLGTAIWNQSSPPVDARNNWWGDPTGPKDASTSTPTGNGSLIYGDVRYIPFLTSPPSTTTLHSSTIDPVIIIPGIMGSAYKDGKLVIDPILHTYDDLIDTLLANGYEKDKTLFTFPYEWRNSNTYTANLLADKIDEVKEICQCEKVDIVAHSMGGLVARWYIQQKENHGNDIDQLIFLGTPHNGSQKAYLQWEGGESDTDLRSDLLETFFTAEALRNGYKNVYSYIHNRPITSVEELLPIFDYIKDVDTGIVRKYPENYPENNFLYVLNKTKYFLDESGVRVTNITGDSKEDRTINIIRVEPSTKKGLWEHGMPERFYAGIGDHGLERGAGDNTVTIYGARLEGVENRKMASSHDRLPTIAEGEVYKILASKEVKILIDNGQRLSKKVLLIQLLSPIDFVVTAPDGKKMGKNFQTGEEYNQIPGAFYSGYQTNDEFISILDPLDGAYNVEVQGTGSGGKYGVMTSYMTDDFSTTTITNGITEPNQVTKLDVNVDNVNPANLNTTREVNLEVFLKDIEGAYRIGWIKDEDAKNMILRSAENLPKFGDKLEKDLNVLLKVGRINNEAYNLLKEDLNYLKNI